MSLLGKFIVWGTQGNIAWSGVAANTMAMRGAELADNVNLADARDGTGNIFGSNARRDTHVITTTLIPYDPASPGSLATAQANIKLPDPGAVVTLDDFENGLFDGDWNYIGGGRIVLAEDDQQTVTIQGVQLRRVSTDGGTPASQTVAA